MNLILKDQLINLHSQTLSHEEGDNSYLLYKVKKTLNLRSLSSRYNILLSKEKMVSFFFFFFSFLCHFLVICQDSYNYLCHMLTCKSNKSQSFVVTLICPHVIERIITIYFMCFFLSLFFSLPHTHIYITGHSL